MPKDLTAIQINEPTAYDTQAAYEWKPTAHLSSGMDDSLSLTSMKRRSPFKYIDGNVPVPVGYHGETMGAHDL